MSEKSKTKFKVGDKVKIILEDDGSWNEDVTELIGKTVTIRKVHNNGMYGIYEDDGEYMWNEYELKLVEKNESIKYQVGDKVIIRDDLIYDKYYDGLFFGGDMFKYRGERFTITNIDTEGHYTLDSCKEYYFSNAMINHEATERLNENTCGKCYEYTDTKDNIGICHHKKVFVKESEPSCTEFKLKTENIKAQSKEDIENTTVFTKSDLKSGHVVRTRDSDLYIFIKNEFGGQDYIFNQKTKGHMELFDYNEDLTLNGEDGDKEFDIIEVYEPLVNYALERVGERTFDTNNDLDECFKLVYKREETKEMTLREIEKQLGYKIKIVGHEHE